MRDGRRLAYVERGDPGGYPVIHHHGMPGSRLQHAAPDEVYRALRVRVITPERPGYGLSDRLPSARLTDWPADVADLSDALGIRRFGVTALSGGGIYALACAAVLGQRVTNVAVTGCPAPMQIVGAFEGMRRMSRAGVWLGSDALGLFKLGARAAGRFAARHPKLIYEWFNRGVPPPDRKWIVAPSFASDAIEDLREALRNGPWGYVKDIELLANPWGFSLEDIRVPVFLWHGEADAVIPIRHSLYLAAHLPACDLHLCPDEGHLLMWEHLEEVFAQATGRLPQRSRDKSHDGWAYSA
jgi:pimeloyl-ACP methyl ester carboxylesterase